MKKLSCIFILPFLLMACGSEKSGTPKDLKPVFTPVINGTWVMKDYIDELAKTKSPKIASQKLQGIVSMDINTGEIQADSLIVAASWNNHEGYVYNLYFKQGQDERSLVTKHPFTDMGTDFYELSYAVQNKDTTLLLKKYNKDKKVTEERIFVKVTGPQTANSEPYGLQYMANKTLFSGKYKATDEQGKTSDVELTDDGMVTGLGTHATYYVYTDFIGDELTNMDEMSFDAFTKAQKPYVFQFSNDTIKLYQALQNEERTQLIQGPLKYVMVKQ